MVAPLPPPTVNWVNVQGAPASGSGKPGAPTQFFAQFMAAVATGIIQSIGVGLTFVGGLLGISLPSITNSLSADVNLNNTSNYFDGPSCAQGTTGTWLATGTICLTDTGGATFFEVKLWDGTTVIASAATTSIAASDGISLSLSGVISSPAGNIRMSARDSGFPTGKILFNVSGLSKDSTLTVIRIG